jgi:hypothetical protein
MALRVRATLPKSDILHPSPVALSAYVAEGRGGSAFRMNICTNTSWSVFRRGYTLNTSGINPRREGEARWGGGPKTSRRGSSIEPPWPAVYMTSTLRAKKIIISFVKFPNFMKS